MSALPISEATWDRLVEANKHAVQTGWAEPGVFGTGIGSQYGHGGIRRILYIGKSAGPLGTAVGSTYDQRVSCAASTRWMEERRNARSQFWQFIERIDPSRLSIAWTNVCKMDRRGGRTPISGRQWDRLAGACITALNEEIVFLNPELMLFVTSDAFESSITSLLRGLGFREEPLDFWDGATRAYVGENRRRAILTRHPQGWSRLERNRVSDLIKSLAMSQAPSPT